MGDLERTEKVITAFPTLMQTTFWQLNPSGSWDCGNDLGAATKQLLWRVHRVLEKGRFGWMRKLKVTTRVPSRERNIVGEAGLAVGSS